MTQTFILRWYNDAGIQLKKLSWGGKYVLSSAGTGVPFRASPSRNCLLTWVQVGFFDGSGAPKIFFAHKFVFVYHVKFLPRGQLLVAHHAGEAVQVEHFAAGFADQVVRRDSLQAARAFSAKTSENTTEITQREI